MELKVIGKIEEFLDVKNGTSKAGKEWKKQSFILKTDEQYNNLYCFEVFGEEKVDNLTKYNKVGDSVEVSFNVSTNEYKGNYYTSLSAWRINNSKATSQNEQPQGVSVEGDDFDLF